MNNYFTISEFANLRGININSLRYYEKIGILKPAYIDQKTNYRYYSTEQIGILNQIILCTTLGIPLKEFKTYIDADGKLHSKELLEYGQAIALKKMNEIQNNLNMIEYMMNTIETNESYENLPKKYIRQIKERRIFTSEYFDKALSTKDALREISNLYKEALHYEMLPMLPAGGIIKISSTGELKFLIFLEIIDTEIQHHRIITIPNGAYECMQLSYLHKDIITSITEQTDLCDTEFIVNNVRLEKYSFNTKPSELQKLILP